MAGRSRSDIPHHQRRLEPEHVVAEPPEASITRRVSPRPAPVLRPIHLHDELPASAHEVTDVACQRHLAAKRYPQLAIGELRPEQLLRRPRPGRERRAHQRALPASLRLLQLLIAFAVVAGASGDAFALAINRASPQPQPVETRPSHGRPQRSEHGRLGGAGRAQAEGRARNRVGIQNDALGNLAAAAYSDGKVDLRMPDAVGNLFRTGDRSDRKYGPAGQLSESRDARGVTAYEYDPEGNLIKKIEPDGAVWTYAWNGAGMLASVTRPDGHVVSFTYDALARRLSKTYRGKTTRWIWDGNVPLHEWVERSEDAVDQDFTAARQEDVVAVGEKNLRALLAGRPANGPPSPAASAAEASMLAAAECGTAEAPITWLFEPESFAPLAKLVGGERYGIVTDHLGTPRGMFDGDGREVWGADIDTLGDLRNQRGERQACPFRWPGQYEDAETGLHYNRFRYYAADIGAFIAPDPIGLLGGPRPYSHVGDPLTWTDALGLSCDAQTELDAIGPLNGKTRAGIESDLVARGFSSVPAHSGGNVWTKAMPDGTTAAVRIDPATVRSPAKGFADEVPHAHKEIVPTSSVQAGNYPQGAAQQLNDAGQAAPNKASAHIPIQW